MADFDMQHDVSHLVLVRRKSEAFFLLVSLAVSWICSEKTLVYKDLIPTVIRTLKNSESYLKVNGILKVI